MATFTNKPGAGNAKENTCLALHKCTRNLLLLP
jgi:hypothetical protein